MGPKKGGAAEPPAAEKKEGANVCYISIPLKLSEEDTSCITSTMNTNCRVDIILDNARRSLMKSIQTQEKTPQPAPLDPLPLPVAEEGVEEGDAAPEPVEDTRPDPIEAWRLRMERLSAIKEKLHDPLRENAGRIVDLFREMDQDGDGLVSKVEFRNVDTILGIGEVPDEVMDEIFEEWDPDESGTIELDELNHLMRDDGLHADSSRY